MPSHRNWLTSYNYNLRNAKDHLEVNIDKTERQIHPNCFIIWSRMLENNLNHRAKVRSIPNKCLRRILKIFWPNTISNEDIKNRTGISPIADVIQKRRWLWLGHVLRMSTLSIPRTALRWTPQGRRDRGRPKETWRRTIDKDLKAKGLTINTATKIAEDRAKWKSLAIASRAKRRRED